MKATETRQATAFRRRAIATAVMLASGMGAASAFEIDTGNPDLTLRWDNTVRYTLGARMEGQDRRILSSPNYDESNGKFGRNDIVTNRFDLFTEVDLNYKSMVGGRLTGAAWYDAAYENRTVTPFAAPYTTSYNNNTYNDTVKRYVAGPSGELLDAFLWTNVKLGEVPVSIKVGRHTNVWGEGLVLSQHAISYSQAPLDGTKATNTPGIETKEVFLPIGQVSAKAQVTNSLSVAGQYFYEWESTRAPHGGTYLSSSDTSMQVDRLWNPQLAAFVPGGVLNRNAPLKPGNTGNWGVNARLNVESIESTFGLYYREFNDYAPQGVQTSVPTASFRFVYPRDVKLYGLSFARVIGPVSFGSELSLRKNAALQASSIGADGIGPRGDTVHAVANGIYLLPASRFWDTGNLIVEFVYNRLRKVTANPAQFKAEGYAGCTVGQDRTWGCSTKNFTQIAVNFTPQYLGVFPSWDLDVPITLNYGIGGVSPNAGGGNSTALVWSLGTRLTYAAKHEFTLRYADQTADTRYSAANMAAGGRGNVGLTDRAWLSFTYKTGF